MSQTTEQQTRTQAEIAKHLKAIEELRVNGLTQDIIDILQSKKHTKEELYNVCKAFTTDYEKGMRQANLVKARANRKPKDTASTPV